MPDTEELEVVPVNAAAIWGSSAIQLESDQPAGAATIWGASAIRLPDDDRRAVELTIEDAGGPMDEAGYGGA